MPPSPPTSNSPWRESRLPAIRVVEEREEAGQDNDGDHASIAKMTAISVDPSMVVSGSSNHDEDREDSMHYLSDEDGGLHSGGGGVNGSSGRKHLRGESHEDGESKEERDKKRRAFKACEHGVTACHRHPLTPYCHLLPYRPTQAHTA